MTKIEYKKCEKLMDDAIKAVMQSELEYQQSEDFLADGDEYSDVLLRKADQHYGEAVGIVRVLVALDFKHGKMEELEKML